MGFFITLTMKTKLIFDKRKAIETIFYDGTNAKEVIEFFSSKHYVKFLIMIGDELHYKVRSYDHNTLIKPNIYLSFKYDEDDGWYASKETKESFNKYFISVTIDSDETR